MLALDDLLNMVGHALAALQHPCERFRPCGQRRRVSLEQLEEIALLRKQALEPAEHVIDPCLLGNIIDDTRPLRRGAKAAVAERPDHRLKIGLLDRRGRCIEREPAPFALVHFLPYVEFARHGEREHLDIVHDRGAVRAALAIFIAADRGRAHGAKHARLLLGLDRRRGMAVEPGERVALGNHPAPRAARGDEKDLGRPVLVGAAETIGKNCDLAHLNWSENPATRPKPRSEVANW